MALAVGALAVGMARGAFSVAGAMGEDGTTGDEVLELMETTPEPTSGFEWFKAKGRYSWQKQACFKGREHDTEKILEWFVASDEMGWGFEGGLKNRPTPDKVQSFTDVVFRKHPIFLRNPSLILSDDAASIRAHRDHLLAYAIPELSKPTGKCALPMLLSDHQTNCQTTYIHLEAQPIWARTEQPFVNRWLHSDIKDVAFPFTRSLYRAIIEQGALKWNGWHSSE